MILLTNVNEEGQVVHNIEFSENITIKFHHRKKKKRSSFFKKILFKML
jgi:hypothetical protein